MRALPLSSALPVSGPYWGGIPSEVYLWSKAPLYVHRITDTGYLFFAIFRGGGQRIPDTSFWPIFGEACLPESPLNGRGLWTSRSISIHSPQVPDALLWCPCPCRTRTQRVGRCCYGCCSCRVKAAPLFTSWPISAVRLIFELAKKGTTLFFRPEKGGQPNHAALSTANYNCSCGHLGLLLFLGGLSPLLLTSSGAGPPCRVVLTNDGCVRGYRVKVIYNSSPPTWS